MRAVDALLAVAAIPLLASLAVVVTGVEQECWVCAPEGGSVELERQFPGEELPLCGRGEDANKICPPNYHGCLTQYHGGKVVRGCGELNLTVCQTANGVEYCYCSGKLCNREEEKEREGGHPPPDDEEFPEEEVEEEEGSGRDLPTPAHQTPPPSTTKGTSPTSHHSKGHRPIQLPHLLLATLFLIYKKQI